VSDWVENFTQSVQPVRMVLDAAGVPVPGVIRAKDSEDGVIIDAVAFSESGEELVGSKDGGASYEPVIARMIIPDGMIVDIED
jgi:hypothetical protein